MSDQDDSKATNSESQQPSANGQAAPAPAAPAPPKPSNEPADEPVDEAADSAAEPPADEPTKASTDDPAEAFKQGIGLLWKAARSTADEIKREVERGGISEAIQAAGRELENAATQAAKSIEGLVAKVQPKSPGYSQDWPPQSAEKDSPDDKDGSESNQVDADIPKGGGTTEDGEKRNMRIQLEEEK